MGLNIKNPDVESAIRELAAATGEGLTTAVEVAVRERLARVRAGGAQARLARLRDISWAAAPRWGGKAAAVEHGELLYDDLGLPR